MVKILPFSKTHNTRSKSTKNFNKRILAEFVNDTSYILLVLALSSKVSFLGSKSKINSIPYCVRISNVLVACSYEI